MLLTDDDVAGLARRLGLEESVFLQRYTRLASNRAQLSLADQADGSCVFLSGDSCAVYEARPRQCRDFPGRWTVAGDCPATETR